MFLRGEKSKDIMNIAGSNEAFCNHFFSKYTRKTLTNVGPKGKTIATPSTCL